MNNNKKEELNYHNLNEVIGLSKKMLKRIGKVLVFCWQFMVI